MSRQIGSLIVAGCFLFVLGVRAQQPAENGSETRLAVESGVPGYFPEGKRDPFRPFTLDLKRRAQPEPGETTPLQRYDLGQLRLVGTLWQGNPPRAMIEDAAGMGYIVTLGTPVGSNGGVVAAIEPRQVIVEEKVIDFYGNEQVNRVVMEIPSEEGGSQVGREKK